MKYFLLALCLVGCTYNQNQHFMEMTAKEEFPLQRDRWIVEQSLSQPSQRFSLTLEDESRLIAHGVPHNERMIFASIDPVCEKIEPFFEFEVKESKTMEIYDRKGTRDETEMQFVACEELVTAKPIVYAIVSKDRYEIATAEFVPYPFQVHGISLQATHPMLTRFQLLGTGFLPKEKVKLFHESGKQKEEITMFANSEGKFSFGLNPTVLGRLGGLAKITVVRESETYSFEYPWGSQLEKKTFQERKQFPFHFSIG